MVKVLHVDLDLEYLAIIFFQFINQYMVLVKLFKLRDFLSKDIALYVFLMNFILIGEIDILIFFGQFLSATL
jgi:hypothetical protein